MKIFFVSCLMIMFTVANAQLKKGTWNVGTSTNALMNLQWKSRGDGVKSYDFAFNPTLGYFISNRFEIGGGPILKYSGSRNTVNQGIVFDEIKNTSYGINFYARYYLKTDKKLQPYLMSNVQYVSTESTSRVHGSITSDNFSRVWQAGIGAGINWFISPRAAILSELIYTSELNYTGSLEGINRLSRGIDLNVGFRFFLNKKKSN